MPFLFQYFRITNRWRARVLTRDQMSGFGSRPDVIVCQLSEYWMRCGFAEKNSRHQKWTPVESTAGTKWCQTNPPKPLLRAGGRDPSKKLDFQLEDQAYWRTYELSNSAQGYVDGCGFADFVRAQRARRIGEILDSCSNARLQ